jgi:hypothetical protein
MSLELWNTFATFGTFLVIAATAITAIIQLRHVRSSNQVAAQNELREAYETAESKVAQHFILAELGNALEDPAFRYQIANRASRTGVYQQSIAKVVTMGNFFELMGVLVKTESVDRKLVLEIWSGVVTMAWQKLGPVIAILRRAEGSGLWDNFEYLVVLSQDWIATYPNGSYPRGARRVDLEDQWLVADLKYAASQPTA